MSRRIKFASLVSITVGKILSPIYPEIAESSRLLKTAYYRRFQPQLGANRPTETVIIDGLNPQSVTLLRLSDYAARDIPQTWMQRDFLPRFQPD